MKPIYDESLYCQECDHEITISEDKFNGHMCSDCADELDEASIKLAWWQLFDTLETEEEGINMSLELLRLAWWNYLSEVELNNRGRIAYLKLVCHIDTTVKNCYCGYRHEAKNEKA